MFRPLLSAAAALVALLVAVPPAAAQVDDQAFRTPTSCLFDPAFGDAGSKVIAPTDGYNVDRVVFDNNGRLLANGQRVVNNSYVLDRIRAYTPDGTPDLGWGGRGFIDVPGRVNAIQSRTMAIDDDNNLQFARTSYLDVLQIHPFRSDGSYNVAPHVDIPYATYDLSSWGILGPVGAAVAENDTYISAWGFDFDDGSSGMDAVFYRPNRGGGFLGGKRTPTGQVYVVDIATDGKPFLGAWILAVSDAASYVWPFGVDQDLFRLPQGHFYSGIQVLDGGQLIVFGESIPGVGPSAGTIGYVDPARGATAIVTTPGISSILGVAPAGDVIGLSGGTLFAGTIRDDGKVAINARSKHTSDEIPVEMHTFADGSRLVVSYANYSEDELLLSRLNPPTLGPAVTSRSLSDQVRRLYLAYFLREPDAGGLRTWMRARSRGASIEDVAAVFSGSAEFTNRYGSLTDSQFVDLVYRNVLNRSPDPGGRNHWLGLLRTGGVTRGSMMTAFSEGREFIRKSATVGAHSVEFGQVHRLYKAYFLREPDSGGLCYWSRRMVGGLSLSDVSTAFAASPEFQQRYGRLSNREFVKQIYVNILGRAGESTGVDFWTSAINRGTLSRGDVVIEFSEAPENVLATGTLPAR